jgi:NADH:ubiquinone oxidoreductase subunit 6 (subunit J)
VFASPPARRPRRLRAGFGLVLAFVVMGMAVMTIIVIAGFLSILTQVILANPAFAKTLPPLAGNQVSDVKLVGMTLFHSFGLPFEVIGVLLLSATVGVIRTS